jgi:hypothetical protein
MVLHAQIGTRASSQTGPALALTGISFILLLLMQIEGQTGDTPSNSGT